jgi:hypothetical protein
VTEILPVSAEAVEFKAVNAVKFPVPFAAKPIAVEEFVHVNVEPIGVLKKLEAATELPAQAVIAVTATVGVGLTEIVNVAGVPTHDPKDGVTVIVAVIIAFVVLLATNAAKSPIPDTGKPTAVLEFDHETLAPEGVVVKEDAGTFDPLQTFIAVIGFITGALPIVIT